MKEKLAARDAELAKKEKELTMQRGELSILRCRLQTSDQKGDQLARELLTHQKTTRGELNNLSKLKDLEVKVCLLI